MRSDAYKRTLLATSLLLWCLVTGAGTPTPVSFADVLGFEVTGAPSRHAYGDQASQFGELWLPASAPGKRAPVVVLIHGGCWLREYDIGHIRPLAAALRTAGFAVWALEYRRVGETGGGWPGTFHDVALGLAGLRELRADGLDLERVAIVGHSAGGHLALWAAAGGSADAKPSLQRPHPPALRGVIGLAAITDLPAYAGGANSCQQVTPRLMGGTPGEVPERYAQASPHLLPMTTTAVLLQGDADPIVPLDQAFAMPGARLRQIPGAGHFDLIHPGTAAFPLLLDELQEMLAR